MHQYRMYAMIMKNNKSTKRGKHRLWQFLARYADRLSPRLLHLRLQSSGSLQMPVSNAVQLHGQHQRQTLHTKQNKEKQRRENARNERASEYHCCAPLIQLLSAIPTLTAKTATMSVRMVSAPIFICAASSSCHMVDSCPANSPCP